MLPQVSLLVCTLGRTSELNRLLMSLDAQTYRNFEIILVDQNDDNRLESILADFRSRLPILHLRSRQGLSHGRNIGLGNLRGRIVAFPDDDCQYPPDLLANVVNSFANAPDMAGLCGRGVDVNGEDAAARFDRDSGPVSNINLWRRHISFSIFMRTSVIEDIGPFDEQLGVGSGTQWGAGEETDYLCRALKAGHKLQYDSSLLVTHPNRAIDSSPPALARARAYGRGMGFILRRHKYPLWFSAYMIGRPIIGAVLDLPLRRFASSRLRICVARARATGYFQAGNRQTKIFKMKTSR